MRLICYCEAGSHVDETSCASEDRVSLFVITDVQIRVDSAKGCLCRNVRALYIRVTSLRNMFFLGLGLLGMAYTTPSPHFSTDRGASSLLLPAWAI